MENLKEIIEEGQKLAEKRTWLLKGYADLIGKINSELEKIPDMAEKQISYLVREYVYEKNDFETYKRKIYCNLVFEGDAYLEMVLSKETPGNWEREVIKSPSVETIREFAKKLPEMFNFFLSEIKKANEENQVAIDTITTIIAKL